MRKESSNQFTEGLVCDLNPINTPNTVLTDALNATIITYDGNEYSLQNDRGNYPLENCRLKPNYIPVGLKEYGDILYIVSYNPLNDSVEIGTYPSPMEITSSKDNETSLELQSVLELAENGSKYSELIEECETKIWTSDNEEDSKLYPGDKYKIEEIEKSPYKYEALEYYIIDEDRKKHNITDLVFQKEPDENGFRNISWQIPGWLAAQYRLATFDDFSMNIRSLEAPSLSTNDKIDCTLKLNFQFKISDKLFLPSEFNENVASDIGIKIEINDKEVEDLSLSKGKFIDWYSDSKVLWVDTEPIIIEDIELGTSLHIKATPYIKITTESASKEIIYNSFIEEITISLTSIGSYSDFNIGTDLWKFYIDDSDEELYLEYDVTGPYVTTSEVNLYYRVLDIDENILTKWNTIANYAGITNQGIGIIPFEGSFEREGIYIIEFAFYKKSASDDDFEKAPIIRKLVIASKIFSDFVGEYSNFNDIDFDTWINKYKDHIRTKDWKIQSAKDNCSPYSNFTFDKELIVNGSRFKNDALRNLWNLNYAGEDKGLFVNDDWETINSKTEKLISGSKCKVKLSITSNSEILEGPLWDGTPDITVDLSSHVASSQISVSKEKITNIETSIDAVFGSQMEISYESIDSFEYASNLTEISTDDIPIMHVYFEGEDEYANDFLKIKYWKLGTLSNIKYGVEFTDKVVEEYRKESNDISRAINDLLGTKQVGVLFTSICLNDDIAGNLEYRHGKAVKWSDGDGSQTWLFTYLLFRKTDSDNNVAMIPIEDPELWKKSIGKARLYKITSSEYSEDVFDRLKYVVNNIFNNITLCTKDNSVSKGHVVQIRYKEPEILPICSINVLTNEFKNWTYKTQSRSYNLLSGMVRAFWKDRFKDFCGKLFDGRVTTIESVHFYKTDIENTTDPSVSFKSITTNIAILNGKINSYNQSDIISELKKRGTKTKGVYWTGDKGITGGLIELLDSKYSVSNSQYLTVGNSNLEDANVYLTDDQDGIVFGRVNTKVYVKM